MAGLLREGSLLLAVLVGWVCVDLVLAVFCKISSLQRRPRWIRRQLPLPLPVLALGAEAKAFLNQQPETSVLQDEVLGNDGAELMLLPALASRVKLGARESG